MNRPGSGPLRLVTAGARRVRRTQTCHDRFRTLDGLDERTGRSLERAIDERFGPVRTLIDGLGGKPCARRADDIGLDDHIVWAANQKQVLDIVATQQDELPLTVEIINVNDAEPRLTGAPVVRRNGQPAAGQSAKDESKERQKNENDRKGDHVFDRRGQGFGAGNR
jgi:hypothetical protein